MHPGAQFIGNTAWALIALLPLDIQALQMDEPLCQFGTVPDSVMLEKTWVLHNDSDRALHIKSVSLGCNVCMEYHLESQQLAPGESTNLTLWLDPSGMEGPVQKEVAIQVDHPQPEIYKLVLAATVVRPYIVSPAAVRVFFGQSPVATTQRVKIQPVEKMHGQFQRVQSEFSQIVGTLDQQSDGSCMVKLTFHPTWPAGISTADVRVISSHPDDPPCLIKTIVSQSSTIEVIPPRIFLEPTSDSQSRILFVKSAWNTSGELSRVSTDNPADRFRIERGSAAGAYRVFINFAGKPNPATTITLSFAKDITYSLPVEIKHQVGQIDAP